MGALLLADPGPRGPGGPLPCRLPAATPMTQWGLPTRDLTAIHTTNSLEEAGVAVGVEGEGEGGARARWMGSQLRPLIVDHRHDRNVRNKMAGWHSNRMDEGRGWVQHSAPTCYAAPACYQAPTYDDLARGEQSGHAPSAHFDLLLHDNNGTNHSMP